MFTTLWHWPHWALVRYGTALVTALATAATVGFGAWTYFEAKDAAELVETQDRVVFTIVRNSGSGGVTLSEIVAQYVEKMPTGRAPSSSLSAVENDVVSTLIRLTPDDVALVDERWFPSESAPVASLKVFISDIAFGIPQIPDSYGLRALGTDEISELLAPLRESDETIRLSEGEARILNEISDASNQAASRPVSSERIYSMEETVESFSNSFGYYYEYTQWEAVAKEWSEFLSREGESAVQRINAFANTQVAGVPDGAGLFSAVVGMAAIGVLGQESAYLLNLDRGDDRCAGEGSINIRLALRDTEEGPFIVIDWGRFVAPIAPADMPDRVEAAEKLVGLLEDACAETLSRVLDDASRIFGREHVLMKRYLDGWNGVFAARRATSLRLTATISNLGLFDTYIYPDIRVGIGNVGLDEKILLTLTPRENAYIQIEARTTNTHTFRASLAPELSEILHGAFTGGLNYVQAGIVGSIGGPNEVIYSPITPFSSAARERLRQEVERIPVDF